LSIKLAIAGAAGRTGSAAVRLAHTDERFELVAALTAPDSQELGSARTAGESSIPLVTSLDVPCDVLVDFTLPSGTMTWLEHCTAHDTAMVIGPTGYSDEQLAAIEEAAARIPIVKATNFSIGIAAILAFLGNLACDLGEGYDVEVVETHHRHKVDAPSGTALTLVDAIAEATGRSRRQHATYGRVGTVGDRPTGQIGVHAVRMGEVTGQHEIHFSGPGETVTIRHRAHSRDTFASGGLRAAAWVVGRRPALYAMADVLNT